MEDSIWLLAALCAKKVSTPLSHFLKAQSLLKSGVHFWSADFFELCPEFLEWKGLYLPAHLEKLRRELHESVARGHLLLYPGHAWYPVEYLNLDEVPFLLRMKGSPIWLGLPGLSIVGHREPSQATLQWMDFNLSEFFRDLTCFSISGGARGVDQKAHLISLRTGRPTVALLPSGLNCIYPTSFNEWAQELVRQGGALLSEYSDSSLMKKHYFVARNRLISALGCATLIVEARRRSGTLLTAQEAVEQGKPVWVLPGHPLDPSFQGSLDVLADGGTLVRDATDMCLLFRSENLSWRQNQRKMNEYVGSIQLTEHYL